MTGLSTGFRYLTIAGVCFVSSNLIVIAGDRLDWPMPLSVATAFVLVGALGFVLHCRYTFAVEPCWVGFFRYLFAMAANLPLSIVWLWLFATLLGWPMTIAAPLSSASMVLVNFLASRWAILAGRGPAFANDRP